MAYGWVDRVYGETHINDLLIESLIACPTFQRLNGIRQAGPSALAFPFKNVTRFEHSLGVFELLRRLNAGRQEQVAGLLHDISHTAFSHAVDFLYTSEEQAHHEELKPFFLERPDVRQAIERLGYETVDFYDDSVYPLLERPIPALCADRLDYFFRDGLACQVCTRADVNLFLGHLAVADLQICFTDAEVARHAQDLFAVMNRDWWASPTEAYIYNEFGQILKLAIERKILNNDDLLDHDRAVLRKLHDSGDQELLARLGRIENFHPAHLPGYRPAITPKLRWLDPPVLFEGTPVPLSQLPHAAARS